MKSSLSILLALLSFSSFADSTSDESNSEISQKAKAYDTWNEHKILDAEQGQQASFLAKEAEIQSKIDSLQRDLANEIEKKKYAPKDPWREIYDEKRYVPSDSRFVRIGGQILEVTANGMRVFGQIGDSKEDTEYYLINFPYNFKEGENIDPTKTTFALPDGEFSFVTEDGYAKSLHKLNYGKPCARPENADAIENKNENVLRQSLKAAGDEIAAVRKQAADEMSDAIGRALRYDQIYADKGDIFALKRMAARYRDGDGVEKDSKKSDEYFRKADAATEAEADRIAEENRIQEEADLKKKFLRNLDLADKQNNVESMLYVEKCYRYGLGTEKDLGLADQYHTKAVSHGIPPNMSGAALQDHYN